MNFLRSVIDRFARWLLRKFCGLDVDQMRLLLLKAADALRSPIYVSDETWVAYEHALGLIKEVDVLDASGEYKRHVVYAKLIKKFPKFARRSLALAIEVAVPDVLVK